MLRLKADNPGMWFVHCHIEMHHEHGMALILDGSDGLPPPPEGYPTCDYSVKGKTKTRRPIRASLSFCLKIQKETLLIFRFTGLADPVLLLLFFFFFPNS